MGNVEIWVGGFVGGFVGGQFGDHICRLVGQQQFGDIHRALLQHLQRRADPAGDGEFDQGLQLGGACNADVDRQVDARVFQAIGPFDDRLCLECELCGDGHLRVRPFGETLLPAQRIIHP